MAIEISKLNESHIGRNVIYQSFPGAEKEVGQIKLWNDHMVFVQYNYSAGRGIATSPSDLTFENGGY
jgi:hypothetical protein